MLSEQTMDLIIFGIIFLYLAPMLGILSRIKIYGLSQYTKYKILAFLPVVNLVIFAYIYNKCY